MCYVLVGIICLCLWNLSMSSESGIVFISGTETRFMIAVSVMRLSLEWAQSCIVFSIGTV